jgi:DNA-binding NarL/FixJ family response regulator
MECSETFAAASAGAVKKNENRPIRIWLVDDNEGLRALLASVLGDEDGFECERQFGSPAAVLNALSQETPPDIILLDIQMGKDNGLDAISPIKALAKSTHVLMLTTFAGPESRERAFREGASDFMLKTWPVAEIAMHIRQAMELGSVAGLLTAFLGKGKPVVEPELEMAETLEKTSGLDRLMSHLRGLLKLSPS